MLLQQSLLDSENHSPCLLGCNHVCACACTCLPQTLTQQDLTLVTNELPGDRWHGWRALLFTPDGKLLVPIGINCNACIQNTTAEGYKFGTIYELNVDAVPVTKRIVADGACARPAMCGFHMALIPVGQPFDHIHMVMHVLYQPRARL